MDPQAAARLLALARIGFGIALVAAPEKMLSSWIGRPASLAGPQVIGAALGVRDLAIGAGTLGALLRGDGARAWLRAGTASDLVDLAATLRARGELPTFGVISLGLMATTGAVAGAWLQSVVD